MLSVIEEEDGDTLGGIDDDLSDDSDQSDCLVDLTGTDLDGKKKFNSTGTTPLKGRFKQSPGPHS
jgi:hypothetical protein